MHRKGKEHPCFGKSLSIEHKKKLSEALSGRKFSNEHKNKIVDSLRGKRKSKAHRQKCYESAMKLAKPVKQFDLNGKLLATYPSLSEASRKTKVALASISRVCRRKKLSAGNFLWSFSQ
jgi:F0F1-type ATP synthase delta subunit